MIEKSKKDKLINDATDFLFAIYDLGIIEKGMDEKEWIGTFGPPYYVLYLNYLYHFYYEVSKDEINHLCREFANEYFGGNENLIDKMIRTNGDIDSLINSYRSVGLDYASGWGLSFFTVFGLEVDGDNCMKIEELAYSMTENRRIIKPELEANRNVFVNIAKGISEACKSAFLVEDISFPVEYFDGFGLYCTKWFCRFELSREIMMKDMETWIDRSFVTQFFVLKVIDEFGTYESGYDATDCFTMWNHMNKFNTTILGDEKSLINAILVFVETNLTDNNVQNKYELVKEIHKNISKFLMGKVIRF